MRIPLKKYNVSIEYCVPWSYLPRAVSLTDDLLSNYQHIIEKITLITSSGGAFEVKVNGDLIFSKKTIQRRHAEPGEVLGLFREKVGADVPTFPNSDTV